ncbi:hypothetical protein CRUP_038308 [Coryphaenoides rupestris]|nr:hypothetical protein CRUP_038308 [Coryphaenoides rupestris]
MAAVIYARTIVLNLRCSVRRAGIRLTQQRQQHPRRGQPLARLLGPVRLFCCSVTALGIAPCCVARCQAAHAHLPDKKPPAVAAVQVHKLLFLLRLSLRALVLLLKFGPLLLLWPLTLVSRSSRLAERWLDALLWVTESSGPTFIKLGQWASTRPDVFSREFCVRFSRLQVEVRPHPWAYTKQSLRRAFGEAWRSLFVFQSKEPVGSGCVAQVYRGWARVSAVEDPAFRTLVEEMEREDMLEAWEIPGLGGVASSLWGMWKGKKEEEVEEEVHLSEKAPPSVDGHLIPVAIKVEIDLLLMRAGSWLLHRLPGLKWLSLPEIVDEFEKLMTKQNFQDVDFVKFPTPLRPFVTRSVLVETFEESEPIANYLRPEVPAEVKQRIARMGIETLLKMVRCMMGNVMPARCHYDVIIIHATLTDLWDTVVVSVRPQPCPYQLVLLDAGIVAQLSARDLANFRAVFTAVVQRQREMAQLVDRALSTNSLSLGKCLSCCPACSVLLITHKVKLESNFASIIFAIMVLEGLGRCCGNRQQTPHGGHSFQ